VETILANVAKAFRREQLFGREYVVASSTLLVPGVLNGSQGRLYYPEEEVVRDPLAWNMMPLVVYHPKDAEGNPVSARSPSVLNEWCVGFNFNSQTDGRLTSEHWFDVELVRNVDARLSKASLGYKPILPRVMAGQPVELSTGLFTDNEPAAPGAVYNGKPYDYTARNYRPDHVAILPDQEGACSVHDGCGVNVNAKQGLLKSFWNWLTGNATELADNERMCWGRPCDQGPAAKDEGAGGGGPVTPDAVAKVGGDAVDRMRAAGEKLGAGASDKAKSDAMSPVLKEETERLDKIAAGTKDKKVLKAVAEQKQRLGAFVRVYNERMCWGRPCPDGGAMSKDEGGGGGGGSSQGILKDSPDSKDSNFSAIILDRINQGELKDGYEVADALKEMGNAGGLDEDNPYLKKVWKWYKSHQSQLHSPKTNNQQGDTDMFDRKTAVSFLVANCDCWKDKGKSEPILNGMTDDQLKAQVRNTRLVLVVNQLKVKGVAGVMSRNAEEEAAPGVPYTDLAALLGVEVDPAADPVAFTTELKGKLEEIMSKLTASAPPPPADEAPMELSALEGTETEEEKRKREAAMAGNRKAKPQTLKDWEATMPAEARSVWNSAKAAVAREKAELVRKLTANSTEAGRKAAAAVYAAMGVEQLRQLASALPVANRDDDRGPIDLDPDYSGAAGGLSTNAADDAEDGLALPLPTVNWEEESRERRKRQAV